MILGGLVALLVAFVGGFALGFRRGLRRNLRLYAETLQVFGAMLRDKDYDAAVEFIQRLTAP